MTIYKVSEFLFQKSAYHNTFFVVLFTFILNFSCNKKLGSSALTSTEGSNTASTTCSSAGCANLDSSPFLTLKKNSTIYVKLLDPSNALNSDRQIEINGDCSTGESKKHTFTLKLKKGTVETPFLYRAINSGSPDQTALQCVQGKFSFLMVVGGLTAGVYNLSGQMTVSQEDGSTQAPASASFSINLSVSN